METLKALQRGLIGEFRSAHGLGPIASAAVVIFVIFSVAAPETFPTALNMQSMAVQMPEVALLGLAVMLSMVVAGIDLSVVAIANLSGIAMAEYFNAAGANPTTSSVTVTIIGVCIAVLVGAACGAINGLIIGKLRVSAILATLATMTLFGGLAVAWTGGTSLLKMPAELISMGSTNIGGIPMPFVIMVLCSILVGVLLKGSRFGLKAVFVGANAKAAKLSGINEPYVQVVTYVATGVLSAIAGVIVVGRNASATPDFGQSYILLAIVIAVLAGVDPNGGFGTVIGVLLATVALIFIQSGFVLLGFSQFFYQTVEGAILITVLATNVIRSRRRRPRKPSNSGSVLAANGLSGRSATE